jgi:pyruvate/2-oxoglutarate/acetoin dehydrogenase E1 component
VLTTPISEAGIIGVATGMALRGFHPVVEIMFGDFTPLIADQVINHLAKFRWMYNDQVRVPLVIRTPMGGRRGYGPTHSQTLEKLFLGLPGLKVIAANNLAAPGDSLYFAIRYEEDPVLFIEHKLLYPLSIFNESDDLKLLSLSVHSQSNYPIHKFIVNNAPPAQLTMISYGYMAELARQALLRLAYEEEIFCELIVPTQLSPLDIHPYLESIQQTHRVLTIEEGNLTLGWGAEIITRLVENLSPPIRIARVAAKESPIPASPPLEEDILPNLTDILKAVRVLMDPSQ